MMSKNVAYNMTKKKTTTSMMKVLTNMYEKSFANNKVFLMKKLFHLKIAEGNYVATHRNKFNTIVNQLSFLEIDFKDKIQALILLASLPNSWESMKTLVSNSLGSEKLKFNNIRDCIYAKEVWRIDFGEASIIFVLNVKNRRRSNIKSTNKHKERLKSKNGRGQSRFGRTMECWNCGKQGHIQNYCRASKKPNEIKRSRANAAITNIPNALLLLVDNPMDFWLLDLEASFYTIAHRDVMKNYITRNYKKVYLANGKQLDIVGIGDVNMKMLNGHVLKITKVRHVPKLMRNLISMGQLDSEDHVVSSKNGIEDVIKDAMVVA